MAFIFALSVMRAPEVLPEVSGIDKLYHFGAYLILGLLLARALSNSKVGRRPASRTVGRVFLITFLFGAAIEVCQSFLPWRSAEVLDAAANGAGGLFGAFVYVRFVSRLPYKEDGVV